MKDNGCTCDDVRVLAGAAGDAMPDGWLCIRCRAAEDDAKAGFARVLCWCGVEFRVPAGHIPKYADCGRHED